MFRIKSLYMFFHLEYLYFHENEIPGSCKLTQRTYANNKHFRFTCHYYIKYLYCHPSITVQSIKIWNCYLLLKWAAWNQQYLCVRVHKFLHLMILAVLFHSQMYPFHHIKYFQNIFGRKEKVTSSKSWITALIHFVIIWYFCK